MTLPRSAADVLAGHVLCEIEAIDRMYLNLYQPRLQHGAPITPRAVRRGLIARLSGDDTRAIWVISGGPARPCRVVSRRPAARACCGP